MNLFLSFLIIFFSSDIGDYEFTSTSRVAELKFDVVNMTAADDFRSFGFEASVEFVRLDTSCDSTHRVYGASGELRLASVVPVSELAVSSLVTTII